MSLDPTRPTAADPAVALVIANRKPAALILIVLGLAALAGAIYYTARTFDRTEVTAGAEPGDVAGKKDPVVTSRSPVAFALVGYLMAVVLTGSGLWMFAATPRPTAAAQETEARKAILVVGGLFGGALMIATLVVLATGSIDPLLKWLEDRTATAGLWKPVVSLLVFLFGAGIAFFAAQPARAEERNNPAVRRMVYATNLGLTTLLLLLVLVVGNVAAAIKLPNRLDTTESGFYTLDPATVEYLAGLTQPVTAYTTIAEDEDNRVAADARRLLTAAHDANPGKFQVRYLSPVLNKAEITTLRNRFPQADLSDYGILLTTGEDEKQYAFLRLQDLIDREATGGMGGGKLVFQGESKLVRELLFLTENKTRPVLYVTTGHGELEVVPGPAGRPAPKRGAGQIRAVLEKAYVDVRPLEFDLVAPKVPDDASVVAVLDPTAAFPREQAEALRKYLAAPTRGGKKGKLIVAASPHVKPGGGVTETGLEGLLAEYNVELGQQYVYTQRTQELGYTELLVGTTGELLQARNPIALDFQDRPLVFRNCRTVTPGRGGNPQFTAQVLFGSVPPGRITWLEDAPLVNPQKAYSDMRQSAELLAAKRATNRISQLVAVIVSEGGSGRLAVFGSGEAFADPDGPKDPVEGNADLFAATVNWLRDRPAVANVTNKKYGEYVPNKSTDGMLVFVLPVLGTMLGVVALGLGVWVFRRT